MKIRMTMRTILGLSAVVLALTLGGREAAADHVFQLVDVTFGANDTLGGTATGTFTTNDALTALVTYDLTTSSVAGFPGFEYKPATAPVVNNQLPGFFDLADSSATHILRLVFLGGLTATGATLSGGEENDATSAGLRFVASGSVVGVPEPSGLVLGGIAAAAGLGLWTWRRRTASRAG